MHKHKCDQCGHIWEHGDDCVDNLSAHTCAKCGREQWRKYFPDEPTNSEAPVRRKAAPLVGLEARRVLAITVIAAGLWCVIASRQGILFALIFGLVNSIIASILLEIKD